MSVVDRGGRHRATGCRTRPSLLSTEAKLALIEPLVAGGRAPDRGASASSTRKRVPQMADAEAVAAGLPRGAGVAASGWCSTSAASTGPSRPGVDEVNVVVVATRHVQPAQPGHATPRRIAAWHADRRPGPRRPGCGRRVTVAAAFGCPFEGEVAGRAGRARSSPRAPDAGADEIALADTIGVGVPAQVRALADVAAAEAPGRPAALALPQHPQHRLRQRAGRGRRPGVRRRSTPAPAASAAARSPRTPPATSPPRTWSTCCDRSGFDTGVDSHRCCRRAARLGDLLGHEVPGQLAGPGGSRPDTLTPKEIIHVWRGSRWGFCAVGTRL